jgi:hypothetical protein
MPGPSAVARLGEQATAGKGRWLPLFFDRQRDNDGLREIIFGSGTMTGCNEIIFSHNTSKAGTMSASWVPAQSMPSALLDGSRR